MRKFLLLLPILAFSVNVPSDFINAYKQGKEDEFLRIKANLQDLKNVIKGMLAFREYLLAGKIPPPIVYEKTKLVATNDGLKIVKKIEITFPKDVDLSELEKIKVVLTEDSLPQTGYYVYFPIQNYPDYAVGYLKLQLKQLNYQPFVYKNWLVAGVYQSKADAEANAQIINTTLHRKHILSPSEWFTFTKISE